MASSIGFHKGVLPQQCCGGGSLGIGELRGQSVFFVLIMNWLYYKFDRNVWIAVLFHLCANMGNEIFATHPDSKVIQSVLFLVFLVFILRKDKGLFFSRD